MRPLYKNLETGEIAPAHRIGTNDEGEVIYQYVEGWEPVFTYYSDEDGNWIHEEQWSADGQDLVCHHTFVNGICVNCFCPETNADLDRAVAAMDAAKEV
jgi:hypothetical protein